MKIILVAAALLAMPLAAPAQAQAEPHHDAIRYASIKSCAGSAGRGPCGPWRLTMHSGEQRTLPDAQTVSLMPDGATYPYLPAPVAVSGDGTTVAYFVKKSRRIAVRTLGGGVTLLPANATPKEAQHVVELVLSNNGDRLAIKIGYETGYEAHKEVRIFDTSDGSRVGTIPRGEAMLDFSADGGEVISTVEAGGSVIDLVVRADTGERLSRATPPQLVVAGMPLALAADGRTVAGFIPRKSQLLLYDVESDQVLRRVPVKLPKGDLSAIDWTGDQQITLHLLDGKRMTVVEIDSETGTVKVRDRYRLPKDAQSFAACGG